MSDIYRLLILQNECFRRGHKKWAKALGQKIREFKSENPDVKIHW